MNQVPIYTEGGAAPRTDQQKWASAVEVRAHRDPLGGGTGGYRWGDRERARVAPKHSAARTSQGTCTGRHRGDVAERRRSWNPHRQRLRRPAQPRL